MIGHFWLLRIVLRIRRSLREEGRKGIEREREISGIGSSKERTRSEPTTVNCIRPPPRRRCAVRAPFRVAMHAPFVVEAKLQKCPNKDIPHLAECKNCSSIGLLVFRSVAFLRPLLPNNRTQMSWQWAASTIHIRHTRRNEARPKKEGSYVF